MLRNKADYRSYREQSKDHKAPVDPFSLNEGFVVKFFPVTQMLELATDDVSSNTTITACEIPWSNQTFTNESAFRKMFAFGFTCHEAGVTRRRGSSKSSDRAFVGFYGQRVLGINSSDCAPIELGFSEDVINDDFALCNQHAWVPKQKPSKEGKPDVNPRFGQEQTKGFGCQSPESDSGEYECHNRHDAARSGVEKVGLHFSSLTHPLVKVGAY